MWEEMGSWFNSAFCHSPSGVREGSGVTLIGHSYSAEPIGVCIWFRINGSNGLAATEENPGVLEFSQKWFGFQGGGPLWVAGQLARLHPPTCSGLCLEAGTLASPSRKHRMSGSACCWGSACPTPPLCSPGSWVNPGYTCLPSPGGCSRILACPSPRVGLPCGAQRSRSGCGPGTTRPRTPGQGGSLAPKVWACLFSHWAWEVCGGQALPQKGVVL